MIYQLFLFLTSLLTCVSVENYGIKTITLFVTIILFILITDKYSRGL